MKATVQRFRPVLIAGYLATGERAVLPCGCVMFAGINQDTGAASTAAQACSEAHQPLTDMASEVLRGWLPLKGRRPLVAACRAALTRAARDF